MLRSLFRVPLARTAQTALLDMVNVDLSDLLGLLLPAINTAHFTSAYPFYSHFTPVDHTKYYCLIFSTPHISLDIESQRKSGNDDSELIIDDLQSLEINEKEIKHRTDTPSSTRPNSSTYFHTPRSRLRGQSLQVIAAKFHYCNQSSISTVFTSLKNYTNTICKILLQTTAYYIPFYKQ